MILTKRQKEILIKLYLEYDTTSSDRMGCVLLYKGDDIITINSKSTNQLIVKGLIIDIDVGSHSSGYTLTKKGTDLTENILAKQDLAKLYNINPEQVKIEN